MLRLKISVLALVALVVAVVVALLAPETHKAAMSVLAGLSTYVLGLKVPLLMGTVRTDNDAMRVLIAMGIFDGAGGIKMNVVVKTANYNIVSPATSAGDPSGTVFTNRGAVGAVTFTLPAPVPSLAGVFYDFLGFAAQNMLVATLTADTLVVSADAAADSLAMSTVIVGNMMRAVCDGTSWYAFGVSTGVGGTAATFTIAT